LVGLLDRIRGGSYVSDESPPAVTPGRQGSVADASERIRAGESVLAAARDLLDRAGRATAVELYDMIADAPGPSGRPEGDALLG
jgi:hypothetical protein